MESEKRKCLVCGHEWLPRTEQKPMRCPHPKCQSPYWNDEVRIKPDLPEEKKADSNIESVRFED